MHKFIWFLLILVIFHFLAFLPSAHQSAHITYQIVAVFKFPWMRIRIVMKHCSGIILLQSPFSLYNQRYDIFEVNDCLGVDTFRLSWPGRNQSTKCMKSVKSGLCSKYQTWQGYLPLQGAISYMHIRSSLLVFYSSKISAHVQGEMVVIPAGCAHQVKNDGLGPNIKIAQDFIAPQSALVCLELMHEVTLIVFRLFFLSLLLNDSFQYSVSWPFPLAECYS